MSDQPQQPSEPAAAPSPSAEVSESEIIRRELVAAIDSGKDLRDPKVRTEVCRKIENDHNFKYGNATKLVPAALKIAAKNAGQPEESFTKNVGGADVKVKRPKPVNKDEQPPQAVSNAQASTEQQAAPTVPAKPKLSEVYAAAKDETELKGTLEYKWLHKQIETGVGFIEGVYKRIGIIEDKDSLIPKNEEPMMLDMSVQMCMKYDWAVPDRLEKLIFFGAWGMLLIMPPLAKFGVLDSLKDGTLGKKKKDPKTSDAPLTETKVKV